MQFYFIGAGKNINTLICDLGARHMFSLEICVEITIILLLSSLKLITDLPVGKNSEKQFVLKHEFLVSI